MFWEIGGEGGKNCPQKDKCVMYYPAEERFPDSFDGKNNPKDCSNFEVYPSGDWMCEDIEKCRHFKTEGERYGI